MEKEERDKVSLIGVQRSGGLACRRVEGYTLCC